MSSLAKRLPQPAAAPDLQRFDRRSAVREAYAQEQQARVRRVPRSRAQRVHVSPAAVGLFLCTFAMLFLIVYSYMTLSVLERRGNKLSKELAALENENILLGKELENRVAMSDLAARAEALGMVKPDRSQITYVDLSGGDETEVLSKEPMFSRVWAYLGELWAEGLEYLG